MNALWYSIPALLLLIVFVWLLKGGNIKMSTRHKLNQRFGKLEVDPAPPRKPLFLVLAPNYAWFSRWCKDNGGDPRGEKWIYLSEKSSRGRHRIDGDRVIILNWEYMMRGTKSERDAVRQKVAILMTCQYTTYEDEHHQIGVLRDLLG